MSSRISPKGLIISLLLLVLAGVFYAWYQTLEWEDQEYDLYPRAIAYKNDYLAASRLLEKHQYRVTQPSYGITLNELPKHDVDIMWLSELDSTMQQSRVDALFDWIEAGGHLVSTIDQDQYDPDYETMPALNQKLLEYQIIVWSTYTDEYDLDIDYSEDDEDTSNTQEHLYQVQLPDGPAIDIQLHRDSYFSGTDPQAFTITNTLQESMFLTQPLGRGRITLLNSPEDFANYNGIENADNAYFLLWIANLNNATSMSIIENTRTVPDLMATLWAKVPLVICTLLAVLVGWLIYVSRRLGPVEIEYDQGRSNLLAHLAAKAQFWKRHGRLDTLLQPLREAAMEKIRPHASHSVNSGHDNRLSNDELDYAATIANCSRTEIQIALTQEKLSSTDFSNSVLVLRNLTKHRTSGPNKL